MVNPRIGSLGHRDAAPLAARSSLRIPHGFAGVVPFHDCAPSSGNRDCTVVPRVNCATIGRNRASVVQFVVVVHIRFLYFLVTRYNLTLG